MYLFARSAFRGSMNSKKARRIGNALVIVGADSLELPLDLLHGLFILLEGLDGQRHNIRGEGLHFGTQRFRQVREETKGVLSKLHKVELHALQRVGHVLRSDLLRGVGAEGGTHEPQTLGRDAASLQVRVRLL